MEANNTDLHRPSHKRKRSTAVSSCFSRCFRKHKNTTSISNNDVAVVSGENYQLRHERPLPKLTRTSSTWLISRINDLPEIRDRYRNIVSKLGRPQRRRYGSDFSYDAFSYALNFDDGLSRADEFPPRSFSARLPQKTEETVNNAVEANVGDVSSMQPIGEVSAFKFQIGNCSD